MKSSTIEQLTLDQFQCNKPLKEVCTFGIGGPALYFKEIHTSEEMQQAILVCKEKNLPYIILGKGSNCLFDDRGFQGAVLSNKIDFLKTPSAGVFHVGAGYSFSLLGAQTARQNWAGLEFASGIPASVGGAVYMNAGANGSETCEHLVSVDFITDEGRFVTFQKSDLRFGYRHSPFQSMRGAIVGATFALSSCTSARAKQLDIINYRKKTQPYGDKSAGCVFRNPPTGHAGTLIDQAGLKGVGIGGAKVSELHANFIVNTAGATSLEVLELIDAVRKKVKETAGVHLESEVRIIKWSLDEPL